MKSYIFSFLIIVICNVHTFAMSDEEKGLKIAKDAYDSTRGYVDSTSEQIMILIDPKGNEVIREISGKNFENMDPNDGDKSLIFFNSRIYLPIIS